MPKPQVEYFVPVFARFDMRKISQIKLEKSWACLAGTMIIDVQLNPLIAKELEGTWRDGRKQHLGIDFQRDHPFLLPFYDPQDFEESE